MNLLSAAPRSAERPGPARATGRPGPAFLVLTALVALHVVDDSYLQPPSGTTARDHLVGGAVLLAALAAAACLHARGRPGTAGATAMAVGAGAVLLGAGALAVWRSRRTDGTRARRWTRLGLRGLAALLTVGVVVQPIAAAPPVHARGAGAGACGPPRLRPRGRRAAHR
jgi:uncharacterized membrane protein (UPF0136 family)